MPTQLYNNERIYSYAACDYLHQILDLMGIVVTDPPYSGTELNRLDYLIGLLLDNWGSPGGGGPFWNLNGNTVPSEKFIGTVNNYAFPVRVNNSEVWAWETNGTITRGSVLWSIASGTSTSWGYNAGAALPSGANNVMIGYQSGQTLSSGTSNTFVGANSGILVTTGIQNTMVGAGAGGSTTGDKNAYFGYNAGTHQTTGVFNVELGAYAGRNFFSGYAASAYNANVFIGQGAGDGAKSGSYNIFIGLSGGYNFQDGNRNILIGNTVISTSYGAGDITNPWPATNTSDTLGFGNRVQFTASNQIVFGSETYRYNEVFFGEGTASTAPQSFTYARTNASGGSVSGATTYIAVSRATGAGISGNIVFQWALSPGGGTPTTLASLQTGWTFVGENGYLKGTNITDDGSGLRIQSGSALPSGNNLELSGNAGSVVIGDAAGAANNTRGIYYDNYKSYQFTTGSDGLWVYWNAEDKIFSIGDINSINNGTILMVDVPHNRLLIDNINHDTVIIINGQNGKTGDIDLTTATTIHSEGGVITSWT